MRRIAFFVCLAILVNSSYAQKSQILPLPSELAVETPWFAMLTKDSYGGYNDVLNKDKLKSLAAQKKSKKVALTFYSVSCLPCREGLTLLNRQAAKLQENRILIVLVNVGDTNFVEVNEWLKKYAKEEWLLGFDKFGNLPETFGLAKQGNEISFPKTLLLDSNLQPLKLIGREGEDFPQILWEKQ